MSIPLSKSAPPPDARTGLSVSPRNETVLYTLLVLLYLVPVWAFTYFPTQDGPAHLANALILKHYRDPETSYSRFLETHAEPVPNWTCHALLVALLHVFPPLVAEKVLVSLYILSFAWAFRYFLGAFGPGAQFLAPAGLIFLFARCLLMGFYNYCLSMTLYWSVLGFLVRRRQGLSDTNMATLCMAFLLTYFTHLVGYLLMAFSGAFILLFFPRRLPNLLRWGLALFPSLWLASGYFTRTHFFQGDSDAGSAGHPLLAALQDFDWQHCWTELASVNRQIFEPYEPEMVPLGLLVFLCFASLVVVSFGTPQSNDAEAAPSARLPVALLALAIATGYVVCPNSLGPHGGLLKSRLAVLPFMLWLGCLQQPTHGRGALIFKALLLFVLITNWLLVLHYFRKGNEELREFNAAVGKIGDHRTMFVVYSPTRSRLVDPLDHAGDYYCLGAGMVNLDNHQATTAHFPLRFRSGVERGRNDFLHYPNRADVDTILVWDTDPAQFLHVGTAHFRILFQQRRLTILVKQVRDHS